MKPNYLINLLICSLLFSVASFAQSARVQAIHNSADAAAAVVDVYIFTTITGNQLLLEDFKFRDASPFVDAPAGIPLTIKITAPNGSPDDPVYEITATLADGATYILVADGILSPTGYMPAPAFGIEIYDMGREAASSMGNTDVLVHHGSTDAPMVDVNTQGESSMVLVNDISYGEFSADYLELPTDDYFINVSTADGATIVKAYNAPLATLNLDDAAITVVASGFLDPSMNSDGPAFGLYAALATGGPMVALPESKARVQVIHNSADVAAASVDVYLNDAMLIDNFEFRTASAFIDAPAGIPLTIDVAPGTSSSSAESIYDITTTLTSGETYVLVADGIVSPDIYSSDPNFGIEVYAGAREVASTTGNTDILVHHGSTDAPTVDVNVQDGMTLVDDISYTEFASNGYLELPTSDYQINISTADGATIVQGYDAPLATLNLDDAAITVVASGFLTPDDDNDGPAFGLWVALASGGALVELPTNTLDIRDFADIDALAVYPVPVQADRNLFVRLPKITSDIDAILFDMSGREVLRTVLSNETTRLNVGFLEAGMYVMTLNKGNDIVSVKISVN